ncbi:hypothetical protein [Methylovulum psychrotolerans]|uniref:Uncharacterized protein n=1 Tax=Methylovulum psychrotolerans TaxID=1704499 RepID=A0A1Z4C3G4_9GAMM|nr:hypothetical protein [Methylovulum psychrotolerans]ASF48086.1 hypothetical protein CEK71_19530 [Methylovulum psychrotolerans]
MLRHLLRPISYLSIDHKLKWEVDWLYPLILAIFSTILLFGLKQFGQVSLYADNGIIAKILGFVQVLPGFYIAALAAIATFNKTDIDKIMPTPAPRIDIIVHGQSVAIELTRRRFLCSMFAFLTAESLMLIVLAIFAQSAYMPLKAIIQESWQVWVSGFFIMIFFLLFWQMIVASFWGLYYLGERLHQPDT